jgi:Family of unknown function (DUF6994)
VIDTTFDFRTDAAGKDPDTYSPTLCRYHQVLWSKPLPSGDVLELVPTSRPPYYCSHTSRTGEFVRLWGLPRLRRLLVAAGHDHRRLLRGEILPPFDDFRPPAIPQDLDTYREYRRRSIEFVEARNRRIGIASK